jgi:hypothetical protein
VNSSAKRTITPISLALQPYLSNPINLLRKMPTAALDAKPVTSS